MGSIRARARRTLAACLALLLALTSGAFGAAGALAADGGAVFTLSNATAGNEVLAFRRQADGSLTFMAAYPTGGLGTGAGLGSQGSVVLSSNGQWLLAVNAGSDSLTAFRMRGERLLRTAIVPSGGDMPLSVTVSGNLVYVLNAGGAGNITGFRLGSDGSLALLPGSTRFLSNGGAGGGVGPAQVQFQPGGRRLVVTEKLTNLIDTYRVWGNGYSDGPVVNPSHGATPFGFDFTPSGGLIVSEAFGGAPDASATSSYRINDDGTLRVLSGSVPTTETAACWVVVSKNGKYAYATNTGSDSVSGYAVARTGRLTLLDADGVTGASGDSPIDAAQSHNGRYLYALNANSDDISIFEVNADGSLTELGTLGGLPASVVGLAAL
jgi:6-phosphogluconolactonase (cycloisomerase 2 family)